MPLPVLRNPAVVSFVVAAALSVCGGALGGCEDTEEPTARPSAESATESEGRPPPSPDAPTAAPWSDTWLLAEGRRYVADPAFRRESMVASLRNPDNLYSRTRISSYGRGDRGWDLLPEWNPRSRTVTEEDRTTLEAGEAPALGEGERPLWDGRIPTTAREFRELGRRVFFEYPLRADLWVEHGLRDAELGDRLGLERAPDGTTPGVLLFRDIDGEDRVGIACALCHTRVEGGALVQGRARRNLNYGALQIARADDRGRALDPVMRARMESWGPGRADITEDDDEDPVAIPDLWGLRHQSALTQAGTIRHIGPVALALRQETQFIYANHHRSRPPRVLVWALAMYLYSLAPPAHAGGEEVDQGMTEDDAAQLAAQLAAGEALFTEHCAECHDNGAYGGDVVSAVDVGTDPGLSRGVARGTGRYRPAGLLGVADAGPYLHHGAVATLGELLSEARFAEDFEGALGPGAVPGHDYGTDLGDAERAALIAFLGTL